MHDRAEVNCKEVTPAHTTPHKPGCRCSAALHTSRARTRSGSGGRLRQTLAAEPHIMKRPVKAVLLGAQKISIQVATWERAASLKLLSSPRASGGRSVSLSLFTPLRWEAVTSSPLPEIYLADQGMEQNRFKFLKWWHILLLFSLPQVTSQPVWSKEVDKVDSGKKLFVWIVKWGSKPVSFRMTIHSNFGSFITYLAWLISTVVLSLRRDL